MAGGRLELPDEGRDVNIRRFVLASLAIFVFALLWNGVVHLVVLRSADAILSTIGRPAAQRSLWLSLLSTLALAMLFVWSYARAARLGTMREGLTHGIFFGVLAGLLVDVNQYVLYPVPASLALSWFGFGMIEFCIYGVLAAWFYQAGDAARFATGLSSPVPWRPHDRTRSEDT
jgi:hypothetical protein